MATADELLRDGDIAGARAALVELVRSSPGAAAPRLFLFQLLALAGEWDKARSQLTTLAQLSPEAQMLSVAYGQAIEAERFRAKVFAGEEKPAVLGRGNDWISDLAAALGHFAAGRAAAGEAARERAFDAAPDTPGELDGKAFDWIADADARFGPTFEAIIAGQWGLVPFDAVETITSEGPKDLRDLVWYPVEIGFKAGQSTPAMLPARYPGSEQSDDAAIQLARETIWRDTPAGDAGLGQRLFQLSTGEEIGLLELRDLRFS